MRSLYYLTDSLFMRKNIISLFWPILLLTAGILSVLAAIFLFSGKDTTDSPEKDATAREYASGWKLPESAALLWSRRGMIMYSELTPWNPVQVTEGENPRWSPDGTSIIFTRKNNVWMMGRNFSNQRQLFAGVVAEHGAGAFWTRDGKGITAINRKNPRQVLLYDLASGKISVLHDEEQPPFHKFRLSQGAELRAGNRYLLTFTEDMGHRAFIIDLQEKKYIANDAMKSGDCEPEWAPNGEFLVTTRRAWTRPVLRTDFSDAGGQGTVGESRYLIGKGRSHWPSVSNDSRFVLYSDHTNIYIWPIERPFEGTGHGVQLTRDGAEDIGPNLYIFQEHN